jgi:hypothetical protein
MPEHSPLSAAPLRTAGLRQITLDMRAKLDGTGQFISLPRGTAKPFALLAAFQQAEPCPCAIIRKAAATAVAMTRAALFRP